MAESCQTSTLNINLSPGLSPSTVVFESSTRKATPELDLPTAESSFDEHTLCAYGDISLSNVYFVPGLPSDGSLKKLDPEPEIRHKGAPPPTLPQATSYLVERRYPSVIRNILPVSPAKAVITDDFENLVENLRPHHKSAKAVTANSNLKKILSPRPRHVINLNLRVKERNRDVSNSQLASEFPPASPVREAALPSTPIAITRPKPKEKPLRGYAKLPPRPPIPRWDLSDSVVSGSLLEQYRASLR